MVDGVHLGGKTRGLGVWDPVRRSKTSIGQKGDEETREGHLNFLKIFTKDGRGAQWTRKTVDHQYSLGKGKGSQPKNSEE